VNADGRKTINQFSEMSELDLAYTVRDASQELLRKVANRTGSDADENQQAINLLNSCGVKSDDNSLLNLIALVISQRDLARGGNYKRT